MKTPGFSERTANVTARDRCRWCCNNGWVVVSIRTDHHVQSYRDKGERRIQSSAAQIEEMGPCPMCQQGWFEEFGDADHQTKAHGLKPPWGETGFWGPQPYVELVPLEEPGSMALPRGENARRMRALLAGLSVEGMAA